MKAGTVSTTGNKKIILVGTFIVILLLMTAGTAFADTGPLLVKADAISKQIIYLTFDKPIQDPNTSGGNITVTGLSVNSFTRGNDNRVLKVVLAADMGKGNVYPTPTSYTVTATNIKDLTGNNTISTTISFDAFTPHGKYSFYPVAANNSTPLCGLCHSTHNANERDLLNGLTIKKICFVCHGILGSSLYKVEGEFIRTPGSYVPVPS